jgi:hypothetical protein
MGRVASELMNEIISTGNGFPQITMNSIQYFTAIQLAIPNLS